MCLSVHLPVGEDRRVLLVVGWEAIDGRRLLRPGVHTTAYSHQNSHLKHHLHTKLAVQPKLRTIKIEKLYILEWGFSLIWMSVRSEGEQIPIDPSNILHTRYKSWSSALNKGKSL